MASHPDAAAGRERALEVARREVRERYGRFAREEAPGRSAMYEEWAAGVGADDRTARLLARIPATRRQPPLVFAVTRLLGAPLAGYPVWAEWLEGQIDLVVEECSRRGLQTNEPRRCAALLPALSIVDGPIALLEIGASAGLCLYPDRYSYRYVGERHLSLDPADGPSRVVLESELRGDPPLRIPEIVWRAGIDIDPLDARDPLDRRFLTTLVWPGEQGRVERIQSALDLVAMDPPLIIAGDAVDPEVLLGAIAGAPMGATLVITTPGVLPHIPKAGRARLVDTLLALPVAWISIDPTALHTALHTAWRPALDPATWGGFVLSVDARPVAAVDALGAFVEWRPDSAGVRG